MVHGDSAGGAQTPVLGVDVGGTSIKAGVVRSGQLMTTLSVPSPRGAEAVVAAVAGVARDLSTRVGDWNAPRAAGVVVPGIVDERTGCGVHSENLKWKNVPLRQMLQDALEIPVAFGHDVRAGALAEYYALEGPPVEVMTFMPIGTGIACATIVGGELLASGGFAGEVGHAPVGNSTACTCGGRGCLESVASARAVAARYSELSGMRVDSAAQVIDRLGNDEHAQTVWEDALEALATALSWTASVLAPEVIVIGGGLAKAEAALLEPLGQKLQQRLHVPRIPELRPARLGDLSALYGASLMAEELDADDCAEQRFPHGIRTR